MSVTIHDVAERLGLSIATVSRALDDYPDIALKTRQRVHQAALEMGYTPNRAARQLRRKRADAIGYILPAGTPRFADPFYTGFLVGLGDETALFPFDLLVSIAAPDEPAEQQIYTNWVQSRKVDGFVLNRIRRDDWRVRFLDEHGAPFVSLENAQQGLDHPYIEVDNLGGMVELVAHLVQGGYQRLAFIGGPEDLVIHTQRLDGFRRGLELAGLPFDPRQVVSSDLTSDGGCQAIYRLRWESDPPDAIVCVNDETAIGALRAAHEMGLQVGSELAISGFEGGQASGYTDPPLTTLEIPVYEIARRLVQMLAAEIQGRPLAERQAVFHPRLLARESTHGRP